MHDTGAWVMQPPGSMLGRPDSSTVRGPAGGVNDVCRPSVERPSQRRFMDKLKDRQRAAREGVDPAGITGPGLFVARFGRVQDALPGQALLLGDEGKGDRFMVSVDEHQEGLTADDLAELVALIDPAADEPHAQAPNVAGAPVYVAHLLSVTPQPVDILDLSATDRPTLEEIPAMENRVLLAELEHVADKVEELERLGVEIPGEPAQLVVLAVSVVIATLRLA